MKNYNQQMDEEIILFLQDIYEYCIKVEFKEEKLKQKSRELNLNDTNYSINELSKKYINYLNLNETTKIIILSVMEKMENNTLKTYQNTKNLNPILNIHNIKTYNLWENDQQKELYLKEIYNYCLDVKYRTMELEILSLELGISSNKIIKYAKTYAMTYLNMSVEEYHKQRNECSKKLCTEKAYKRNKTKIIFEKLLKTNNKEEIITILKESNVSIKSLYIRIHEYLSLYGDISKEEELVEKFKIYFEYEKQINKQQREQEKIKLQEAMMETVLNYIKEYINGNYVSKSSFCKNKNITEKEFAKYIRIIKVKCPIFDMNPVSWTK